MSLCCFSNSFMHFSMALIQSGNVRFSFNIVVKLMKGMATTMQITDIMKKYPLVFLMDKYSKGFGLMR